MSILLFKPPYAASLVSSAPMQTTVRFGKDTPVQGAEATPPVQVETPAPGKEKKPFKQRFKEWVKAGMPITKITEKNRRSLPKQLLFGVKTAFLTAAIGWGSIFGVSTGVDKLVGDGPMPALTALKGNQKNHLMKNSSQEFAMNVRMGKITATREDYWKQLQPLLPTMKALSKEVHDWFVSMYEQGRVVIEKQGHSSHGHVGIAEYNPYQNQVILYDDFFFEPDGYKVGIIFHEYRHSRENWGKRISHLSNPVTLYRVYQDNYFSDPSKFVSLGEDSYGNILEDQAHLFEHQVYQKMGITPRHEVVEYLTNRNLLPKQSP